MHEPITALAALMSLAASPAAAEDWNSVFRTAGWVSGGYDTLSNLASFAGDVSVSVPFALDGFEISAGVHLEGLGFTPGAVIGDIDVFAGLHGGFGDFYAGDVPHATTALMPRIRKSVSPFQEIFMIDVVLNPISLTFVDLTVPADFARVRYDGSFGDVSVSVSYEFTTQNAAAAVSYSFGSTTVYGGVEGLAGFAATSFLAAVETSFDRFDIAAEASNIAGTTMISGSVEATYNVSDAFSVSGMLSGRSGIGLWNAGAALDYHVNDHAKASVGVNRTGGLTYFSAGFQVDLD